MKTILIHKENEILVHTSNGSDDYFTHYFKTTLNVFKNKYILTAENCEIYSQLPFEEE